jgi:hypothetical protein
LNQVAAVAALKTQPLFTVKCKVYTGTRVAQESFITRLNLSVTTRRSLAKPWHHTKRKGVLEFARKHSNPIHKVSTYVIMQN